MFYCDGELDKVNNRQKRSMEEQKLVKRQKLENVESKLKLVKEPIEMDVNSLPEELLIKIFSHLTHNELGKIARVCRKWKNLTRSPVLWKKVDVKFSHRHESPDVAQKLVSSLSTCTSSMKLNFVDRYKWHLPLNYEDLSLNLERICPNLEVLVFDGALLNCDLSTAILLCAKCLRNVRILCFVWSSFSDPTKEINFDCISKIEVLSIRWCSRLTKPPFSKMPLLRELHVVGDIFNVSPWFEDDASFLNNLEILNLTEGNIYSYAFRGIRNTALNLTELYVCYACLTDDDFHFDDSTNVFPHLKVICVNQMDDRVTMSGVLSLIRSCRSLEKIYLFDDIWEDDTYAAQPFAYSREIEIIKVDNENVDVCPHDQERIPPQIFS